MKTAISLPDDLFAAAESAADKLGLSRSQLYQRALRLYLTQQGQDAVTSALNRVYTEEFGGGGLDPSIAFLQGASLIHDEDPDAW